TVQPPSPEINITERWDLPAVLKEVSGIAYIDKDRFACIQDEDGTIFIYNRASKKVEKEIPFAGPGDYEDISLIGNTAWVVRADGRLYETDITAGKQAKEYATPLTVEHNIEGLSYDKKNNRLLLAVKDDDAGTKDYKNIYAFDLAKKTLVSEPVIRIDVNHELLGTGKGKKEKTVRPSALEIHPVTGELYVTDGPQRRLIVMDASGNIKRLLSLGKSFQQPEGIAFSPQGELFISNEGTKEPGNILQVNVE
ncbi:MAG: hypothetical protein EOO10_21450, partial [Chitinophagaceae bacterium]